MQLNMRLLKEILLFFIDVLIAPRSLTLTKQHQINTIDILFNKKKLLNDLIAYIMPFSPMYNEIIYQRNKVKFEKQSAEITAYV